MIWFIFAFLAAIFDATYFAFTKKLVKNVKESNLATGVFLAAFLVLFIVSLVKGFPKLGPNFILAVVGMSITNIVMINLYYTALKIGDISLAVPMMSFTPIFLIATSFFFLGELSTLFGIIGIFFIVFGSYFLNFSFSGKYLDPFKSIFKNKTTLYMLIVAFLASIAVNFEKMTVLNSDIFFGSSIVYLIIGSYFLLVSLFRKGGGSFFGGKSKQIFLLGFIVSLIAVCMNIAFTMQIVPYVVSIKRVSLIFAVLYGRYMFKEKDTLKRFWATLAMLLGVVLIVLFG